jgi:predicted O-methyltransferase YrrM
MSVTSTAHKTMRTLREEGPRAVITKTRRRARFVLDVAAATWAVRSIVRRDPSIDESLEFAFGFSRGEVTVAPAQIRSEIEALLGMLSAHPPRTVLEIGTARGGTLFLLGRVATADARIASIDLPGGTFGGGYDRIWVPLLKMLPSRQQTLRLMRADSHDPRTHARARSWLTGEPLDFLLIDGDHRFDGVRGDFLTYGSLVRPGGLIAIHDIVPGDDEKVGGVPAFWKDVKRAYPTEELVQDWEQGGFGLGVVTVPPGGIDAGGANLVAGAGNDPRDSEPR